MKPTVWPRYMREKRLKDGGVAYYWAAQTRDVKAGFKADAEALGPDYGEAVARATFLNQHLDAWREGRDAEHVPEAQPGLAH